ncbi:MAG: FHA domain-containing protein [Lachnospiraceae bacterium]|nr:FHA domain-containing protein [Lachnospiraceae bacterium]
MWSQKELKINYFFLIDVSGSMTTSNFKATKEEVKYFAENNMNANDTLTIYTVGDDVECVVDRKTRDDNEEIEEIVDSITGDNNATYLDDAISETADNIMKYNINFKDSLPDGRDIIVAFTDGENCSKDGKTQNDAKEKLKESGATMYGFLQDSVASGEARKNFDEMSRNSGGNSRIFTADNLNEELNSLVNELNEVYVVECKDINNKIDDEYKKLSLTIYDDTEEIAYLFNSRDVMVDKSVADNIHPEIVSVTVLSGENENKINVQFSESVLGADDISHYILSEKTEEGEKPVSIAGVKYDKNTYLTTITLYEPLYSGEYILEINDVTDNTWEENSLNGSPYEFTSNGPEYVEEEEKTEKSFFARFWWLIVIGIIILFAIVLLVIYRVIKKRKGVIVVDGKATFADNVDIKKHVIIEEEDKTGKDLSLYLNSGGKIIKKIDTKINGSIIIGRSDLCDIFIDDATMSRQHFAIEYTDGDFYVQDLDTTNGTMLNGVKLVHKRRLEKDDRITAGSLDIIVRW